MLSHESAQQGNSQREQMRIRIHSFFLLPGFKQFQVNEFTKILGKNEIDTQYRMYLIWNLHLDAVKAQDWRTVLERLEYQLTATVSHHWYEKCKQRTHQPVAAGRVFGTLVALETDFRGTSPEMLKGWPPKASETVGEPAGMQTQKERNINCRVKSLRFTGPSCTLIHLFRLKNPSVLVERLHGELIVWQCGWVRGPQAWVTHLTWTSLYVQRRRQINLQFHSFSPTASHASQLPHNIFSLRKSPPPPPHYCFVQWQVSHCICCSGMPPKTHSKGI